jgi:hypothetical protein
MKVLLLLLFSFSVFSCTFKKERLDRAWLFLKAEYPDERAGTDYVVEAINPMAMSQESFLDLQEDGSYTSYFGSYEEGRWQLKKNQLVLSPAGDWKVIPFEVRSVDEGKLELYYAPRAAVYSFEGYENKFTRPSDNPFYYRNNKWRRKAERPESDSEIRERVKNHFRFFEKYLAWAQGRNIRVGNISSIASPLQVYSNGFELVHFERQSYQWKELFYDTANARTAYNKIYRIFREEKIDWNTKVPSFKMLELAFQQMQQKLR